MLTTITSIIQGSLEGGTFSDSVGSSDEIEDYLNDSDDIQEMKFAFEVIISGLLLLAPVLLPPRLLSSSSLQWKVSAMYRMFADALLTMSSLCYQVTILSFRVYLLSREYRRNSASILQSIETMTPTRTSLQLMTARVHRWFKSLEKSIRDIYYSYTRYDFYFYD